MAQLSIRIDDALKARADALFNDMGLNMTTAVNMFITQAVRDQGFPFKASAKADPFYSESNMKILRQAIADYEAGRTKPIVKTMEELEAMANA